MKKSLLISSLSILFASCSNDKIDDNVNYPIEISPKNATITSSQSITFKMKKGSSTLNSNDFVWSSGNDKIAEVSSDGTVTPKLIGQIEILSKEKTSVETFKSKLIINPVENIFKEPVLLFGKPKQEIKTNESRTLISETTNSYNHDILTYKGENNDVEKITYIFFSSIPNSSSYGLTNVSVQFRKDLNLESKISKFYSERYIRDYNIITDWWGYDLNKTINVGVSLNSVANPNSYRANYSLY